jgi:hypothetical protein
MAGAHEHAGSPECRVLRRRGASFRLNSDRGMSRAERLDLVKSTPGAKAALNLHAA